MPLFTWTTELQSGLTPAVGHIISHNTLYIVMDLCSLHHAISCTLKQEEPCSVLQDRAPTGPKHESLTMNRRNTTGSLVGYWQRLLYDGTDGGGTEIAYNVIHDQHEPGLEAAGSDLDDELIFTASYHNLCMGREGGAPVQPSPPTSRRQRHDDDESTVTF